MKNPTFIDIDGEAVWMSRPRSFTPPTVIKAAAPAHVPTSRCATTGCTDYVRAGDEKCYAHKHIAVVESAPRSVAVDTFWKAVVVVVFLSLLMTVIYLCGKATEKKVGYQTASASADQPQAR